MPGFQTVDLQVDEAAALLRLQPATVRRRLQRDELRGVKTTGGGATLVRLSPSDDWLRVEDAGALLGIAAVTVRSNITRGRLTGRRDDHGRWRVLLASVLEDGRCDPAAVALFTGEASPGPPEPASRPARPHSMARALYTRLDAEEADLLERGKDRFGTIRAAVVAGLRAIDDDQAVDVVEVAELRAERDLFGEQLERVRVAHRNLRDRHEQGYVDELYCHHCERLVPLEEVGQERLPDGTVELYHERHGHRHAGKLRASTVIGRRAPLELDAG